MAQPLNTRSNPYVGPRSFEPGERLYGRDRETQDLIDQLIAERVILLYSPSGAGKTSLLEALLMPQLAERNFHVWPRLRVGLGSRESGGNRYLRSVMQGLEKGGPPLAEGASLEALLTGRLPAGRRKEVLIFDQFEEILTLDPADNAVKAEFFTTVGELLQNPRRWVIFSMREEFIAGLDPWLHYLPTRISNRANRFRLDQLDATAALAAIQEPARASGVEFADDAAHKLIDDLRRVRTPLPAGGFEETLGASLEPVQLQVVCRRLWESIDPAATAIALADVERISDVDQALRNYYADEVKEAAEAGAIRERTLRDWIDRRLMAASGLRNQVMLAGDDDRQVRQALPSLVNGHLVRAEQRRGVTWYELAHDRLIEPVRTDNREWRLANLSLLQRQAVLWDEGKRDGGLLLMGAAYSEAEEWAKRHPDELERLEQEFLTACRQLALRRRTEQILFGVVTVLMVLAIITAGVAYAYSQQAEAAKRDAMLAQQSAVSNFQRAETARQRAEAETARAEAETARAETERQRAEQERLRAESQLQVAQARQLAAEGRSALDNGDTQLALLLGIVAQSVVTETAQGETLLRAALHSWRGDTVLPSHSAALSQIALSPDNQLLLTGGDDGVVVVRTQHALTVQYTLTHAGRIAGMVFTPDGTRLATGSRDGTVRLWNVPTGEAVATLRHPGEVRSLQLAPDQITLAARSDNRIYLYDIRTGATIAPSQPLVAGDALRAFEFHPGGGLAVASVNNRTLQLWSLVDGRQRNLGGFSAVIDALRFSRDGHWLVGRAGNRLLLFAVTLTDDGAPNLSAIFDTESDAGFLRTPLAESNSVTAYQGFALSNDSQRLAAGSADGSLRIWLLQKPGDSPLRLRGHTEQVSGAAFSPDGRMLATTSLDNSVIFWRVSDGEMIETLRTGAEVQQAPAFGRDNRRLYTGDNQGNLYVWQVAPGDVPGYAALQLRPARALAQAGEWLAAAGSDGLVELWNSASGERTAFDAGVDRIDALAIAANGRLIATGSATGEIFLFDPTSGREVARWPAHRNGVRALRFLPAGGLVSAGGEPEIRLWDETGAPAGTLTGHSSDVNALALSADGALLYSGSADGSVRRWRLADGVQEAVYQTSTPLLAVAVSGDGGWLAAGGFGFNGAEAGRLPVTVWRVAEPTLSVRRLIHPRVVRSLAFLPDGRLVTADEEGDLNLWSLVTGERVSWRAHGPGWTTAVAADPTGRLIYSLGNDSLLRAWYATSGDLVAAACGQIDTRLTNEEWAELLPGSAPQPLCQQPAPLPTLVGSPLPPNLPAALQPPAGRPLIDWFDAPTGSFLTPGRPTYLRWSIEQATAVYLQKDEGEPEGQIGRNTLRISEPGRYRLRVQSEAGEWVEEIEVR